MIGSTRHNLSPANFGKIDSLNRFRSEYERVCREAFNFIWENGYKNFSIQKESLSLPKMLDYKLIPIESTLSKRALQCAINQAGESIRACVEKQRRVLWVKGNRNANVAEKKFSKPENVSFPIRLNANCCDFQWKKGGKFSGFVRLKCLGKDFGAIKIPIQTHKHLLRWQGRNGKCLNSVIIFRKSFQIVWEVETNPYSQGSKVLGIDQGLNSVATLSDGSSTPKKDSHGHSLSSILDKISRKKKGSKGFNKAARHRKNFINWSINQLNFSNLKEVRLEKVINIRNGKRSSRKLSHWSNPEIRDKILRRCEELEVPVIEQSSSYRSQRCSHCGNVRKANRKGDVYHCKNCGSTFNADYNAALNHVANLPEIPKFIREQRLNLGSGFLWNPNGVFSLDGSELIVPNDQKIFL